jgi:DNA repair protein RadC
LAHELLNYFGSLSAVFDASPASLKEFGLSDNATALIKLIPDFARLYLMDQRKSRPIDTHDLVPFFVDKFVGRNEEALYLLLLDSKEKQVFSGVISKGSINTTDVPIRRIIELVVSYNAKYVAIAHNHVSGMALPSKADLDTTAQIYKALKFINVIFLDHVIVSQDDATSLAQTMYGRHIFIADSD